MVNDKKCERHIYWHKRLKKLAQFNNQTPTRMTLSDNSLRVLLFSSGNKLAALC